MNVRVIHAGTMAHATMGRMGTHALVLMDILELYVNWVSINYY